VLGEVVTAAMMAAGDRLAQVAYRRVPWVRQASHDQLRWVLNDLAARGWDEQRTVAWLGEIAGQYAAAALLWRPGRPHALIAHALRQEAEHAAQDRRTAELEAASVEDTTVPAVREAAAELDFLADLFGAAATTTVPLTELERQHAAYLPAVAAAEIEALGDRAYDRYGPGMVARYLRLDASPHVQLGVTR
jgi:hypothetical protein